MRATITRQQLFEHRACAAGLRVFDEMAPDGTLTWERGGARERRFREDYEEMWSWLESKGLIREDLPPGRCPRCDGRASMDAACAYCKSTGKVPTAEEYVEALRDMFGPTLSAPECLEWLREQARRRAA